MFPDTDMLKNSTFANLMNYSNPDFRTNSPAFVVIALVIAYVALRFSYQFSSRKVLLGYPFLGYALTLSQTKYMEPMIDLCKRYGPIFDVFILFARMTVISNINDAKEVLSKRPKTVVRPLFFLPISEKIYTLNGLFMADGDDWGIHRRITAPSLSQKAVSNHINSMWDEAVKICTNLKTTPNIKDFETIAMSYTIAVIGHVAFGLNNSTSNSYFFSEQFPKDVASSMEFQSRRILCGLPNWLWRLSPYFKYEIAALDAVDRIVKCGLELIEVEKQKKPENNESSYYLQQLIHNESAVKLNNIQIISNVMTAFLAGTDTTSIAITWSMYFLSIHKQLFHEVREEVDIAFQKVESNEITKAEFLNYCPLLKASFKEALRLRSPAAFTLVQLSPDVPSYTLKSGITLYNNDLIWLPFDSFNRDETVYKDAANYNPYRWLTATDAELRKMEEYFHSFGGGPRVCPGILLASAEGPLLLAHLVHMYNFDLQCAPHEVERVAQLTIHSTAVPLMFTPRTGI